MNRTIRALTLISLFLQLHIYGQTPSQHSTPNQPAQTASVYSYSIIPSANNTFGYDIIADGKPFIHQATIPGGSGTEGFQTKKQAGRAATLVIQKLKTGSFPPTLSDPEIDLIMNNKN